MSHAKLMIYWCRLWSYISFYMEISWCWACLCRCASIRVCITMLSRISVSIDRFCTSNREREMPELSISACLCTAVRVAITIRSIDAASVIACCSSAGVLLVFSLYPVFLHRDCKPELIRSDERRISSFNSLSLSLSLSYTSTTKYIICKAKVVVAYWDHRSTVSRLGQRAHHSMCACVKRSYS